jgi:agmatinase
VDSSHDNQALVPPVDPRTLPRYAGWSTFARLPRIEDVSRADVAVIGVPFDTAVTYRPGARFGPGAIRQASRLIRGYNPELDVQPFDVLQVVDAGDVSCTPFDIGAAVQQIETALSALLVGGTKAIVLGGDHSVALPSLRAVHAVHGPVALVHFDAHLDTWDSYFGADITHGTPFRRAFEEGLLLRDHSIHVGLRGSVYDRTDFDDDTAMGFDRIGCSQVGAMGVPRTIDVIRQRLGNAPVYMSVDIDVLDPAHAPGTGTPEAGGLSSRELLDIIRGLATTDLVGADIVEVSPAYDHAEITAVAASTVAWEILSILAANHHRAAPTASADGQHGPSDTKTA